MKKLLIGCGLILILGMAACTSVFIYSCLKINKWATEFEEAGRQIQALSQDFPFTAPDANEDGSYPAMEEADFQRYLTVRQGLAEEVRTFPVFGQILDQVGKENTQTVQPSLGEVISIATKLPAKIKAITEVFRAEQMSPEEFSYLSARTIAATKTAADEGDEVYAQKWNELPEVGKQFEEAMAQFEQQMAQAQSQIEQQGQEAPMGEILDGSEVQDWKSAIESLDFPDSAGSDVDLVIENRDEVLNPPFMLYMEFMFNFSRIQQHSIGGGSGTAAEPTPEAVGAGTP